MASAAVTAKHATVDHRNEVRLTGRLSTYAEARELPSGDEVVGWRLVIDRPVGGERAGIDAIDCVAFTARVRRTAVKWQPGEIIEVEGALRRRYWRNGTSTASRFEVEVSRAARVRAGERR
ncbi:MAG TPA: single-stranded DNA-binding protein [Mycobacteriales bacterium]|nr:single-stranded DNA-binding protein [Mycobacteriales bacterium]